MNLISSSGFSFGKSLLWLQLKSIMCPAKQVCWRNLSDLRQVRDSGATEPEHLSVGRLKLWAEAALAGYKTDIATDKAELGAMAKQSEGGSREGARGRLAVEYRLEKKLLLASAIRTLAVLQAAYSRFNSSCE